MRTDKIGSAANVFYDYSIGYYDDATPCYPLWDFWDSFPTALNMTPDCEDMLTGCLSKALNSYV